MRLKLKKRVDHFIKSIEVKMQESIFITTDPSMVPNPSCLPLSFVFHWATLNTSVSLFFFLQIFIKQLSFRLRDLTILINTVTGQNSNEKCR